MSAPGGRGFDSLQLHSLVVVCTASWRLEVAPAERPDEDLKVLRIRRDHYRLWVKAPEFDRLGGEENITIQRRVVGSRQTAIAGIRPESSSKAELGSSKRLENEPLGEPVKPPDAVR